MDEPQSPGEPDAVTRLIQGGAPAEPIEEGQLLAELKSRLFGEPGKPITLSRYVVLERLAAGGSGVVYRAFDPELDRKVAIKLLNAGPNAAESDTESRARLLREAQAMARLAHPNVISVFDVGTYDEDEVRTLRRERRSGDEIPEEGVFIVMELVDGPSLSEWLRERPRRWREVLEVFMAAGRGLGAAHQSGLVHRDFKPANVLVGRDGRVRVLDFGLARALGDTRLEVTHADPPSDRALLDSELTRTGTIMGTPAYMAPEQHRGSPADHKADQFAFCIALWEGLHGELPYPGRNLKDLEAQKLEARPSGVGEAGRVPAWLNRALVRGLAPDPADRFAGMQELLAVLERGASAGRRRRPWLLALGTGAVAVASALVFGPGEAVSACGDSDERLVGIWDRTTRGSVRQAFAATDAPFAAAASAAVEAALDEYVTGWKSVRREVCGADLADDPRALELQGKRLYCLDRHLTQVGELVSLWTTADAGVVEHAVEAARELRPPAACLGSTSAEGGAPDPTSELGRRLAEVDRDLARATALRQSGRYGAGLVPARRAVQRARELEHVPTEVRGLLVLADLEHRAGNAGAAEAALDEALAQSERTGSSELALEALVKLVEIVGVEQARHAEGNRLGLIAASRMEFRDRRDVLTVDLALNMAKLRQAQGRYGDALMELKRAREVVTRLYGGSDPKTADVLHQMGNVLDRQGEYEQALTQYRKALDIRRSVLGETHPQASRSLNNIANVTSTLGRHSDALADYYRVLANYEQVLGPKHPLATGARNNIGVVLGKLGRHEEAEQEHRRVLAIRQEVLDPGHPDIALSHTNLGTQLDVLERYDEALAHHELALDLRVRALGPDHPDVAWALNNVAATLASLGRDAEALEMHERALTIRDRALGKNHPDVAHSLRNMASVLMSRKRSADALAAARRALEIFRTSFGEDHEMVAASWQTLGDIQVRLRDPAAARDSYENAIATFERARGPGSEALVEPLRSLAALVREGGEADEAAALEARAAKIAGK